MNQKILTKKQLFLKFQLIPILCLQVKLDFVQWHCSMDYGAKLILVNKNLWANCSYFTLKCFLRNSFREMCFLAESYK